LRYAITALGHEAAEPGRHLYGRYRGQTGHHADSSIRSRMTRSGHRRTYCAIHFPIPSKPNATDYDVAPIIELEWRSDMRQKLGHPLDCNCLGRRNFLKMAGGATVAGITGGSLFSADRARADALSKELRDKLTPEQIIQAMKKGNKRFRAGERKERNYLREQKASAKG
jgi:hypothetical protein